MTYYREIAADDLHVRDDGKTLEGLCVPYETPAYIHDLGITEVFRYGAFKHQLRAAHRLGLYDGHAESTDRRLGVCRELREEKDGLYGTFRLLEHRRDTTADLIAEGHSGLSIGFDDKGSRVRPDGTVERWRAHLAHVALVSKGAYATAGVTQIREDEDAHPDQDFWANLSLWELERGRILRPTVPDQ